MGVTLVVLTLGVALVAAASIAVTCYRRIDAALGTLDALAAGSRLD